ncbi:hypothetical protein F5880DRAFT_1130478 [Lentinula raphanica]|nr:hypothetical protein F5880DRAFT_1130478 [Lentinula raphanica]
MPRITRAQQLAESEANRRMFALNQTRGPGQAGGADPDFQSNQGQARPEGNTANAGRLPSPFLDDIGAGRNSMDFNPPLEEGGRGSGGVPEGAGHPDDPPTSDDDEEDSDYSPGRTLHSQSSFSNRSDYDSEVEGSDFDDLSSLRRDAADHGENFAPGHGARGSRKATAQRRFLESDNSSDEDYIPSRPLTQRSVSRQPTHRSATSRSFQGVNSRSQTQRSDSRPPFQRSDSQHSTQQSEWRPPTQRSESRPPTQRSASLRLPSQRSFSVRLRSRSGSENSRRSPSPIPYGRRRSPSLPPHHDDRHARNVPRRVAATAAHRRSPSPIPYAHRRPPSVPPRREDRHAQHAPRRAAATDAHRREYYDRNYNLDDHHMEVDPQLDRLNRVRRRRGDRDEEIVGYQSLSDDQNDDEEEQFRRKQTTNWDNVPHGRGSRRRHSRSLSPIPQRGQDRNSYRRRSRSPSPFPYRVQRDLRRRHSRSLSPSPRRGSRRDAHHVPAQVPSLDNFRRSRREMPDDQYYDRCVDNHRAERGGVAREKENLKPTSRSKVPFPKVTESIMPKSDPVGMLTSVSQAVIRVLRNGWSEPIPLGHFARRHNLLFTSHTAPQLDISSFHIMEGGQVRLKNKQLHDISIMDLTMNDWNEIKRNMPRAIREHLIPDDEVFPGSTEALAAAEMIENLFRIVDDRARIGEEYVPLMFYVDTKIQFWRARPERKERIDFFDFFLYHDVYEAWKALVELREEEKREAERRASFKNPKGSYSFQPNHSKQPFRQNAGSSYHGKNNNNKFTKHRCIFCGGDHHSKNHTASASDYLKQDNEGVYRNSGGKRVCFSHNGLKGCSYPSPCKHGEHRCAVCGSQQHNSQSHA